MAEKGGPPSPPPIPPSLCMSCAFEDPDLREPLRIWMKELGPWAAERMRQYVQHLRDVIARPLEAIDRFVDSLR